MSTTVRSSCCKRLFERAGLSECGRSHVVPILINLKIEMISSSHSRLGLMRIGTCKYVRQMVEEVKQVRKKLKGFTIAPLDKGAGEGIVM